MLRLYEVMYENKELKLINNDKDMVLEILKYSDGISISKLQNYVKYSSRTRFLNEIINPLIELGLIYRDGNPKSKTTKIKIKK